MLRIAEYWRFRPKRLRRKPYVGLVAQQELRMEMSGTRVAGELFRSPLGRVRAADARRQWRYLIAVSRVRNGSFRRRLSGCLHSLRHSPRIDEPCSPKPYHQPAPTALPLRRAWACGARLGRAGKRPQVRILSFAPFFKDLGALDPAAGGGKRSLNGSKTEARKQGQQHRLAVANRILPCGSAFAVTTADRPEVPNA